MYIYYIYGIKYVYILYIYGIKYVYILFLKLVSLNLVSFKHNNNK